MRRGGPHATRSLPRRRWPPSLAEADLRGAYTDGPSFFGSVCARALCCGRGSQVNKRIAELTALTNVNLGHNMLSSLPPMMSGALSCDR